MVSSALDEKRKDITMGKIKYSEEMKEQTVICIIKGNESATKVYEYKTVTFGCVWSTRNGFQKELQEALDENAKDGWRLHTVQVPGALTELCFLVFEREKNGGIKTNKIIHLSILILRVIIPSILAYIISKLVFDGNHFAYAGIFIGLLILENLIYICTCAILKKREK